MAVTFFLQSADVPGRGEEDESQEEIRGATVNPRSYTTPLALAGTG